MPSFRTAKRLAAALNIPFGYLFLTEPPDDTPPLPDLRTLPNAEQGGFSAEFRDLFADVSRKQEWYREFLLQEQHSHLEFVGRRSVNDDIVTVARDIAITVGIDEELREQSSGREDFLRRIITCAESSGILVLRSGIVGGNTHRTLAVEEFRGFAIVDDIAPLIFINAVDTKAAQIFTLIHELAHIWIGESGVSNAEVRTTSAHGEQVIERYCNRVAAEVLVPEARFLEEWRDAVTMQSETQRLAAMFRVSPLVILRRAHDTGRISSASYALEYERYMNDYRDRESRRKNASGGNFYNTFYARNSTPIIHAVIGAAFENRLMFRDAANLLNVHVKTLHKIASRMRDS